MRASRDLDQHISVKITENPARLRESPQRQIDMSTGQPDWLGEKKLAMRDSRGGGQEIGEIGSSPKWSTRAWRVVERLLQRFDDEGVDLFALSASI